MGKMLPMLLLVVAINMAGLIFLGTQIPGSTLLAMINNPQDWSSLGFVGYIQDSLLLVGAVGIIIGTFSKAPDFVTFAGITSVLFSFGFSLTTVYTQLNEWPVLSSSASNVAMIITAPLIIMYIYACLKFWRNAD